MSDRATRRNRLTSGSIRTASNRSGTDTTTSCCDSVSSTARAVGAAFLQHKFQFGRYTIWHAALNKMHDHLSSSARPIGQGTAAHGHHYHRPVPGPFNPLGKNHLRFRPAASEKICSRSAQFAHSAAVSLGDLFTPRQKASSPNSAEARGTPWHTADGRWHYPLFVVFCANALIGYSSPDERRLANPISINRRWRRARTSSHPRVPGNEVVG